MLSTILNFFKNGIGESQGMLSINHLIFSICGIICLGLLIIIFYNIKGKTVEKIIVINFFIVFVFEIFKIIWNFMYIDNLTFNNWFPLYFCSFFIYASGLFTIGYYLRNDKLKRLGMLFIVYGQIVSGIMFLSYPSTSIGIYPLIHPLTIHSFIYHLLASFTGIIIVISGLFKYKKNDLLIYSIGVVSISIIAYIFNLSTGSNMMFLNDWSAVAPLEFVYKIFGMFYPLIITCGQLFGTFIGGYLVCYIFKNRKEKE